MMDEGKRALVICAHDDDEVIALGGTIRKLANSGISVTTVVFAQGNEGYSTLDEKDSIVDRRRREREEAERILGTARCIAYDYHDYDNLDCESVYKEVIRCVRDVQPHIVFSHLSADYLAHRTLANTVPEAVWQAGWQASLAQGEPWRVNNLYLFSVLETVTKPTHVVDITATFEAKLKAMQSFSSQHEVVPDILDQLELKARMCGSMISVRYGEAFVRSNYMPAAVSDPCSLINGY